MSSGSLNSIVSQLSWFPHGGKLCRHRETPPARVLFFRRVAPFLSSRVTTSASVAPAPRSRAAFTPTRGGPVENRRAWLAGTAQRRHRYFLVVLTGIGRVQRKWDQRFESSF